MAGLTEARPQPPLALSPTGGLRLPALNRASGLDSPPGTPCTVCPHVRVRSAVFTSVCAVYLCVCLFIQYLLMMCSAAATSSYDCSGSFCVSGTKLPSGCPALSLGVDTQGMWVRANSDSADLGGPRDRCRAVGGGRGPSEQVQTPSLHLAQALASRARRAAEGLLGWAFRLRAWRLLDPALSWHRVCPRPLSNMSRLGQ